jgi:hypothetical protein
MIAMYGDHDHFTRATSGRICTLKRDICLWIYTWVSIFSVIGVSHNSWAEVGDPCEIADDCMPGEVCAPGRLAGDASFCTRVCRADRPCPDGYSCESQGGLALCNTEVILSGLGDPCDVGCMAGLQCLDDGSESYCSTSCTLPGSCPEGYRCRPGSLTACAKIKTLPSIGEPCDEQTGCADPLECLVLPHRSISYCTYSCAELACPEFMVCEGEGEEARCVHKVYERSLGDGCVVDAYDELLDGCGDMLSCETEGRALICTQDCSPTMPCPRDFGCVYRPEGYEEDELRGRCLPDVDSDPELAPSTEPIAPPPMGGTEVVAEPMNNDSAMTIPAADTGPSCTQSPTYRRQPRDFRSSLISLMILIGLILTLLRGFKIYQGRFNVFRA